MLQYTVGTECFVQTNVEAELAGIGEELVAELDVVGLACFGLEDIESIEGIQIAYFLLYFLTVDEEGRGAKRTDTELYISGLCSVERALLHAREIGERYTRSKGGVAFGIF